MSENTSSGNASRVIAVGSGKGGVGKSNLIANLSLALKRLNKRSIMVDADLGLANLNVLFGLMPKRNLMDAISAEGNLNQAITTTAQGVDLIAGANGFLELAELPTDQKENLVSGLSQLSGYDFTLIDCGAGIHNNVLRFMEFADDVILITTPEPTALADAYGMLKALHQKRHSIGQYWLVINRCENLEEAQKVAIRLRNIAQQFLNIQLKILGWIPEDREIIKAVRNKQPVLAQEQPQVPAYRAIMNIARVLNGLPPVKSQGNQRGFWKRLLGID